MSIAALGDIVNDVARAADPGQVQRSSALLGSGRSALPYAAVDDPLGKSGSVVRSLGFDAYAARVALKSDTALQSSMRTDVFSSKNDVNSPYKKFEAFVLQTFVENMLPESSESVFGEGLAGSYWKSMMAEQISNHIASSGGVGIAKMLENAANKNKSRG